MNYQQVQRFFGNFNLQEGVEYKPLSFKTCETLVKVADKWYGQAFGVFVAEECLIPVKPGKVVSNKNDLSFYFDYPTLGEFQCWMEKFIRTQHGYS